MVSSILKKVMYTGVGAAALTLEKAGDIFHILQEKGEQALTDGTPLNQEIKGRLTTLGNNVKDVYARLEKLTKEELERLKTKIPEEEVPTEEADYSTNADLETFLSGLQSMTKEELALLREKLDQLQTDDSEPSE